MAVVVPSYNIPDTFFFDWVILHCILPLGGHVMNVGFVGLAAYHEFGVCCFALHEWS